MTVSIQVCALCRGARWVCTTDANPWHLTHLCCDQPGMPCPLCNPGPVHRSWNEGCLECCTPEEFMTLNPDDPDAILAAMEEQFKDLEISENVMHPSFDPVNVQTLTDEELSAVFNDVRDKLIEMDEMMEAKTREGRELHSQRAAYLIEMQRRGWK